MNLELEPKLQIRSYMCETCEQTVEFECSEIAPEDTEIHCGECNEAFKLGDSLIVGNYDVS